jgi:hypothetical protein
METTTPAIKKIATKLETETCGRCGGSGKFSYNQMDGDRCYGCQGSGVRYTKRGKAAKAFLDSLRKVRVDSLKVGDLIYNEPGMFMGGHFAQIIEIEQPGFHGTMSLENGVMVEKITMGFTTMHPKYGRYGLHSSPATLVKRGFTAEEKAEQFKKALDFQATLTKLGKPKASK